jgi:hypothetical protein
MKVSLKIQLQKDDRLKGTSEAYEPLKNQIIEDLQQYFDTYRAKMQPSKVEKEYTFDVISTADVPLPFDVEVD